MAEHPAVPARLPRSRRYRATDPPALASRTTSRAPPTSAITSGVPQASASTQAFARPSRSDGSTIASAAASSTAKSIRLDAARKVHPVSQAQLDGQRAQAGLFRARASQNQTRAGQRRARPRSPGLCPLSSTRLPTVDQQLAVFRHHAAEAARASLRGRGRKRV